MREFKTKAKPPKPPITFTLDGREMVFNRPSWAPLLLLSSAEAVDQTRGYLDWLGAGLSDEDGQHVLERLLDPKDEFDLEDVTILILGLIEEASGRPTEPPSDSSDSQEATDSTDGRQAEDSTQKPSTLAGLPIWSTGG